MMGKNYATSKGVEVVRNDTVGNAFLLLFSRTKQFLPCEGVRVGVRNDTVGNAFLLYFNK